MSRSLLSIFNEMKIYIATFSNEMLIIGGIFNFPLAQNFMESSNSRLMSLSALSLNVGTHANDNVSRANPSSFGIGCDLSGPNSVSDDIIDDSE